MSRRAAILVALLALGLPLALPAERAWVGNRGGTTIDFFDTVTNAIEGSLTVGSGPVDVCSDAPLTAGPFNLFVANALSNSVSVVRAQGPAAPPPPAVPIPAVIATLTGGGSFGTFMTPSGLHRTDGGAIALVDQKVTTATGFGGAPTSGRSTLRFLNPVTFAFIDDFRDESDTALYSHVVSTFTPAIGTRIWIADSGDGGVVAVRPPPPGSAPLGRTLVYQGSGEFADFIHDAATVPTFLVAPRRIATNGTTRVVVADGGSDVVTILDATYPAGAEGAAIVANLDLGVAAGVCQDVIVVGGNAYVTKSGVASVFRINLTTLVMTALVIPFIPDGLGATADGLKIYVGHGAIDLIQEIDVPSFTTTGGTFSFPGGSIPFAWFSSIRNSSEVPPGSTWTPGTGGPAVPLGYPCGLLGVEIFLVLAVLGLRRRS